MPFLALPSIVTAAAVRLGFKMAEKQKWLPNFVYHQMSMDKFKSGNAELARQYNNLALQKNPRSTKAQIMRDILNMHQDSHIAKMENWIQQEQQELDSLHNTIKLADQMVRHKKSVQRVYNVLYVVLLVLFVAGMLAWGMLRPSVVFYVILALACVGIVTLLIYRRISGMEGQIKHSIDMQEQEVLSKTVRQEITARVQRLEKMQSELEAMLKNARNEL